ncbi:MAG TPA: efflux RND transporter periplasmic adaptor subunit [Spirochaetota bacterium]
MKKILIAIIIILLSLGTYYGIKTFHGKNASPLSTKKIMYRSTMNPNEISDKPGKDSMGMDMVPFEAAAKEKKIRYRSTMNPGEISDKPGKDSMGMDMVPFEEGAENEIETPEGLAPITVTQDKRKLIGLSLSTVQNRIIFREIRSPVKITQDETRQFKVTTKVGGWVENLYVNQTGQYVQKGAPLLSIYSPELLTAQQEYISALHAKSKLSGSPDDGLSKNIDDLISSARGRLRLFDISDAQIDALEKTGTVDRYMTLQSPTSGYVAEKAVTKGQKIAENDPLMMIVDLSVVWGEVDIYETDIPYIKTGMPVEITLSYWPGKVFKGRISFTNPFLSPDTRTLSARIEIPNAHLELKPNMYGEAKLSYNVGKKPSVPESAVMRTGVTDYVFKEGKGDMIIPTEVSLGLRSSDGFYEIKSGLKTGEKVVTSANFLVDSESSLAAAFKSSAAK